MAWSTVRLCAVLELAVMLFQVLGVAALCVCWLMAGTRWADRGRAGFLLALVGLGIVGPLCSQHDSEFALFAGGTMTVLLIGMILGNGQADAAQASRVGVPGEANLAGSTAGWQ